MTVTKLFSKFSDLVNDLKSYFVQKSGDTMTGNLTIKKGTVGTNTFADANPKLIFQDADASQNVSLTFTDYDSVQAPASLTLNGNQGGEYFIAPNIKATSGIFTGGAVNLISPGTRGTTPDSNTYKAYEIIDTASRRLAIFENGLLTNGQSVLNLWLLGHHTSSDQYGGLQIVKDVNNTNNAVMTFNANTGDLSATRFRGKADSLYDAGNGTAITAQYSGSGISSASWFCAWDGYKITAISAANVRSAIGAQTTGNYVTTSAGGSFSADDYDANRMFVLSGTVHNSKSNINNAGVGLYISKTSMWLWGSSTGTLWTVSMSGHTHPLIKFVTGIGTYSNLAAGGRATPTVTPQDLPSGYTPIAVKQVSSGNGQVLIAGFNINSNTAWDCSVKNTSSDKISGTITMVVAAINNNYLA